jgi:hypothetical protein
MEEIVFKIYLRYFEIEDYAFKDSLGKVYIDVWDSIPKLFSDVKYKTDKGNIYIQIDWERYIAKCKEVYNKNISMAEYRKLSEDERATLEIGVLTNIMDYVECTASIDNNAISREIKCRIVQDYIEKFFYDIFVVANISAPGCCNLYKMNYIVDDSIERQIDLYSGQFESAWKWSIDNKWPDIQYIPLMKVWDWYNNLGIGTRQIARTKLERVLFALLHFSTSGDISAINMIWLAHALESLFDTPEALISQTLKNRIFLVLQEPKNIKTIKKKINEFYQLRSSFVHGDFDINHPLSNTLFEDELFEYGNKIIDVEYTAISIIVATLQKMVNNNWSNIEFAERYDGKCDMT